MLLSSERQMLIACKHSTSIREYMFCLGGMNCNYKLAPYSFAAEKCPESSAQTQSGFSTSNGRSYETQMLAA